MIYTVIGAIVGYKATGYLCSYKKIPIAHGYAPGNKLIIQIVGLLIGAGVGFGFGTMSLVHNEHVVQKLFKFSQ